MSKSLKCPDEVLEKYDRWLKEKEEHEKGQLRKR